MKIYKLDLHRYTSEKQFEIVSDLLRIDPEYDYNNGGSRFIWFDEEGNILAREDHKGFFYTEYKPKEVLFTTEDLREKKEIKLPIMAYLDLKKYSNNELSIIDNILVSNNSSLIDYKKTADRIYLFSGVTFFGIKKGSIKFIQKKYGNYEYHLNRVVTENYESLIKYAEKTSCSYKSFKKVIEKRLKEILIQKYGLPTLDEVIELYYKSPSKFEKAKEKAKAKSNEKTSENIQENIDKLLDKISFNGGFESLTQNEKEYLKKISKKF